MNKTKEKVTRLLAVVMSAMLVLSLTAVSAFAVDEDVDSSSSATGTITINNAVVGQTYTVYQILDLESYSTNAGGKATGVYAYKATTAWNSFINGDGIKGTYVDVDDQGYVTWKTITNETSGYENATDDALKVANDAAAASFAKLAQAYAKTNSVTNQGTETAAASEGSSGTTVSVTFSNLDLGYYLVDSTMGTLCSLDTTNPDATIQEKNEAPTNEKKVEEDSTGSYGEKNDADIGDTVNFQSTITAQAGAENYVLHDKMSTGLTYGSVTGVTLNGTTVDASNYEVKTSKLDDDCTFHVVFTQAFCDALKADDQIVVSYTATVNENAVVGGDGNKNESKVEYGESGKTTTTPPSETKTYTWDVDVFKYTMDGQTEKPLAGAKFTLGKKADGTDPIALVAEGSNNNVYRVATADDTDTVTEITTDATGKFTVKGLDSDIYYLTETKAPDGYNKLAGAITIVVGNDGGTTVDNTTVDEVKVLNQSGSELPSTGGMGTTVLYVVGGILVVGAGVALVVRRRAGGAE